MKTSPPQLFPSGSMDGKGARGQRVNIIYGTDRIHLWLRCTGKVIVGEMLAKYLHF